MNNLSITDLESVISTEIPIDTTTVLVEATEIKKDIFTRIFDVNNMSGISFLNCRGGVAKLLVSILDKDCTKDFV